MHASKKLALISAVAMLALALAGLPVSGVRADDPPVSGDGVVPIEISGNPTCLGLGYEYGFKPQPEPPPSGTYPFPDGINFVTINSDGTFFDWAATLGIDAVIVKGGNAANAYVYIPEDTADTNLVSPDNASGNPAAISHIEFCYDYELTASKTANAEYTRTYSWEISKSVDPDSHAGFAGDSFSSDYAVTVDRTVTDSDFAVSGTITVNNPTPFNVNFSVSDSVGGTAAIVYCPANTLAPGASTVCTYTASLGSKINGTNTATITSNTSGVGGATASAPYTFGAPTTVMGDEIVNVSDDVQGPLGSASGDKTFEYSDNFACPTDLSLYTNGMYEFTAPNTATIDETGQTASANVAVTCYALTVTKTADTSLTRTWNWSMAKTGDQTNLTLSAGQIFVVNYEVRVNASPTDSDWAVSGSISVNNPAPMAVTLNSVADAIAGYGAADVDCGISFPYSLGAGSTLNCTYSADLPNADTRTNTATATIQNSSSGTTSFSGTASVSFGNATINQVDECVTVSDDKYGSLGTVCANAVPKTFTYALNVGPYATCGEYAFTNTATFTTNDTGTTGGDDHTVNVNVPCGGGCTLTPGYWKTHSQYGPAPYDDAWLTLGDADGDGLVEGADETFFKSGRTYYQVLWTAPSGNAYYILAHAYIAAKLNIVNGASTTPAVVASITYAEGFFNTYFPTASLSRTVRNAAIANATTLDNYNNGLIGPGHCSE